MTPRTDVCAVCEDMRYCVQSALTEDEKIAATSHFRVHIENAQDRVQLFGVCDEARPQQTNYLFGENDTIGENGTKCHGPNCVVSMLHHFFETHGNGDEECFLHADNCGGQNKNKTVLAYLAWRCIINK